MPPVSRGMQAWLTPDGVSHSAAVVLRSDQGCYQNWMDPEIGVFLLLLFGCFWFFVSRDRISY